MDLGDVFVNAVGVEPNIMTPRLVGYYEIAGGVAELSVGDGLLDSSKLWGVTVVRDGKHDTEAGQCFPSKGLAVAYIKDLKE
jgi:hypothetical protein